MAQPQQEEAEAEISRAEANCNEKMAEMRLISNLETLTQLRNSQMTCFTLAEDKEGNFQPDITWKIAGVSVMAKQNTLQMKSEQFHWTGYAGVRAQARLKVTRYSELAYVYLCLEGSNAAAEAIIDSKLIPRVYYVLRDQTKSNTNRPKKHKCVSTTYSFTSKFDSSLIFCAQLCPRYYLVEPTYNVDESLMVEIYVEPPTMAHNIVHSYDGCLNSAIDCYRKRKLMARESLVEYYESPYFYTGPRGYRVQVEMWLNGRGEYRGKGLTVGICFMTGEFDADLPATFPHRTTVTLLNREDSRRNIVKIIDEDIENSQHYFIDLCADDEVENVMENDLIFYKVTIEPSRYATAQSEMVTSIFFYFKKEFDEISFPKIRLKNQRK